MQEPGTSPISAEELEEAARVTPDLIEMLKGGVSTLKSEVGKLMDPRTMMRRPDYPVIARAWKMKITEKQKEIDEVVARLRTLQKDMGAILVQREAALKAADPQHEVVRVSVEEQLTKLGISGFQVTPAGDLLDKREPIGGEGSSSAQSRVAALFSED
jgi:hypothetical protein